MKHLQTRRPYARRTTIRLLAIALLTLVLGACGGGGDGGIIGTGMQLRGTIHDKRLLAASELQIKAASGQRSTASVDTRGRFETMLVDGTGPYLLKADLGNGNAFYSLAGAGEQSLPASGITQNVHAYSDLAIRNWFATQGLDIDAAFSDVAPLAVLPSADELAAIVATIDTLIGQSLSLYNLDDVDLFSVSFDNDNTGVDNFLDRNPVLINNGTITIIIVEPSGGSQTTVSDSVPLSTDLAADDLVPPTAPDALRALPSAIDEIVLVWNASTDNIGVVSYEVRRDGALVGSSAFPAFIDSPLQSGIDYVYSVTAVDASGNRSMASPTASTQTLAAPDVTAPPAPTALSVSPGTDSVVVSWSQSAINDVASFRVLSGVAGSPLNQLARVTSTTLTDAGLNSGVEYCYQVFAADASENESAPSDVVCATTSGSPVDGSNPGSPQPPVSVEDNHLLAVDVSGLQCTAVFDTRNIDSVVMLDQPCYNVTESISVRNGGQLVINAGTVLKFAAGTGISVREGGSLASNGTREAPVVLSAADPTPGIWDGLAYVFSNSSRNELNHTVIEYGGSVSGAAIETTSTTASPSRLLLNNVLVRNSRGYGFEFGDSSILPDTTAIISTGNAAAIRISLDNISNIAADSRFTGNAVDRVELIDGDVTTPSVLPSLDVPYSTNTIRVKSTLSIAAGSRLEFEAGGVIRVDEDGSLRATGTAEAPITFTGRETTPGFWEGLRFVFSNSVNNRLEHVVVEYAGSDSSSGGGVVSISTSVSPTRISMSNTTLRLNAGPGFRLGENTLVDEFANVQSTGNGSSGFIGLNGILALGADNSFSGNSVDGVRLFNETVSQAAVWPAINVPYLIDDIRVQAPLTLSAGSRFTVDTGGSIRIEADGSLNAQGTALDPIEFFGSGAAPGHWDGISFVFARGPHVIDHVTIAHAGGGGSPATSGALLSTCNTASPVTVNIANTVISDSISNGIFGNNTSCTINVASTVSFVNIALDNVVIDP